MKTAISRRSHKYDKAQRRTLQHQKRDVVYPKEKNRQPNIGDISLLLIKATILSSLFGIVWVVMMNGEMILHARNEFLKSSAAGLIAVIGGLFLMINLSALIWRFVLVWMYRPVSEVGDDELPRCTVVVPAYNEGRQVMITLESLAASDYPPDKLQIIAVDDGSVDDTWKWIRRAEKRLQGRVRALKLPSNRGKRQALYAGFQKSTGDVLVTVDSDSIVETQTLRHMVSPFVRKKQVGAVAGNVRVLNRTEGLIPRMLDVIFVFSFDFIRASQSMVNTVMCTPGALSAYRRSIVMQVLQEWLDQTFCGRPATIGEDRAMTNLILREGHDVVFQQNATVYTNVPTRYTNLCKMFLRWARSNVRETLAMSRFAFKPFRTGSMTGARINLMLSWLTLTKAQVFLLATWILLICHPLTIGMNVLTGIIVSSSLSAGVYGWRCRSTEALWAYLYGIFWFAALFWITPWALVTPHRSGWLTREIKPSPVPSAAVFTEQRI